MKGLLKNKRGSNLIYVVVLISLLGVLTAAYSVAILYNARSAAAQRAYQQDRCTARTLLTSVVDSVTALDNSALDALVEKADDDYREYLDALESWNEAPEEDSPEDEPDGGDPPEYSDYVREQYTAAGTGLLDEGSVKVMLSYFPAEDADGYLTVSVQTEMDGRGFSLGAKLEEHRGTPEGEDQIGPVEEWSVMKYYEE